MRAPGFCVDSMRAAGAARVRSQHAISGYRWHAEITDLADTTKFPARRLKEASP